MPSLFGGKKIPALDPYSGIARGAQVVAEGDSPWEDYGNKVGFGPGKSRADDAEAGDDPVHFAPPGTSGSTNGRARHVTEL